MGTNLFKEICHYYAIMSLVVYKKPRTYNKRKKNGVLATVPRMMSNRLRFKRMNQVSTRTFYFKLNGQASSAPATNDNYFGFRSKGFTEDQTVIPPVLSNIPQRTAIFSLYDEYKVVGISLKLFPSNVGTEPGQTFEQGILNRGDMVVWSDQRFNGAGQVPTDIAVVLNHASARMIDPRRKYQRSLFRPKGYPDWGSCERPLEISDPWDGAIQLLVNNVTPSRPLFWYTLTYKVIVRGRRQN